MERHRNRASRLSLAALLLALCAASAQAQPNTPNTSYPQATDTVRAIAQYNGTIYVGGLFNSIGGQNRNRLAAFNATTGALTSWNPGANSDVLSLHVRGNVLYVGGYFSNCGGQNRNRIAAFNADTGAILGWNPNVSGGQFPSVLAIDSTPTTIYVGGDFTNVNGGTGRLDGAAFDIGTGNATGWNPSVTGTATPHIHALAVGTNAVYIGGEFTTINGSVGRNAIAAVNLSNGAAISGWNANLAGGSPFAVQQIIFHKNTVYAGGYFNFANGQGRNNAAAFDPGNGLPTAWNPNLNGPVLCLHADASTIYIGGDFSTANGFVGRNRVCSVDDANGTLTSWTPNMNDRVMSVGSWSGAAFAGGEFASPRTRLAGFGSFAPTPTPSLTPSPTPSPSLTPTPFNNASYVSNSAPVPFPAGRTLLVGITMLNTGNTTWTEGGNYSLAVQSDPCGLLSGAQRITLNPGAIVPPGVAFQFVATITAPASPGACSLQVRMIQEFVQFFGDSANIGLAIEIPPNASDDWAVYQ